MMRPPLFHLAASQVEVELYVDTLRAYGLNYVRLQDALPHRDTSALKTFFRSHRQQLQLDELLHACGHPPADGVTGASGSRRLR
jgi:hypothetical protein